MGRVADALKRAGELRRDLPGGGLPLDVDFVTEDGPRPPVPKRSVVASLASSPSVFAAHDASAAPPSELGNRLLIGTLDDPVVEEEYRTLGAVLHRAQDRTGVRSVLITSALPQEGKTLTTANLALVLSRSYRRRVLVIDADLRKPSLHDLFGTPAVPGVSDVLLAGTPLTPFEVQPRLWFIPGGSAHVDSAHVVASDVMKRVLEQASKDFDWVLLDTPPARVLPDAQLLLANVDAAVLVVQAGKTPYDACRPAAETLSESGKLLGVILNRGQRRDSPTYYSAYAGQRSR